MLSHIIAGISKSHLHRCTGRDNSKLVPGLCRHKLLGLLTLSPPFIVINHKREHDLESSDPQSDASSTVPLPPRAQLVKNGNAGDPGLIPGSGRSSGEGIGSPLQYSWASLVAQPVKNLPATRETWVRPCIRKIPWEKAWQPTPVFLPGESLWTEQPGGLQSVGSQRD